MTTESELWQFTRADPFCTHCGTGERAIKEYTQEIHDTCPCVCHQNKTTAAKRGMKPTKPKAKRGRK